MFLIKNYFTCKISRKGEKKKGTTVNHHISYPHWTLIHTIHGSTRNHLRRLRRSRKVTEKGWGRRRVRWEKKEERKEGGRQRKERGRKGKERRKRTSRRETWVRTDSGTIIKSCRSNRIVGETVIPSRIKKFTCKMKRLLTGFSLSDSVYNLTDERGQGKGKEGTLVEFGLLLCQKVKRKQSQTL